MVVARATPSSGLSSLMSATTGSMPASLHGRRRLLGGEDGVDPALLDQGVAQSTRCRPPPGRPSRDRLRRNAGPGRRLSSALLAELGQADGRAVERGDRLVGVVRGRDQHVDDLLHRHADRDERRALVRHRTGDGDRGGPDHVRAAGGQLLHAPAEAVRANCRSTSRPASSKKPPDTPAQSAMKLRMSGNGIITARRRQVTAALAAATTAFLVVAAGDEQAGCAHGEASWPGEALRNCRRSRSMVHVVLLVVLCGPGGPDPPVAARSIGQGLAGLGHAGGHDRRTAQRLAAPDRIGQHTILVAGSRGPERRRAPCPRRPVRPRG